jgi:hypothetical protein
MTNTGPLVASNSIYGTNAQGSAGQVLTTDGTYEYWSTPGGTVATNQTVLTNAVAVPQIIANGDIITGTNRAVLVIDTQMSTNLITGTGPMTLYTVAIPGGVFVTNGSVDMDISGTGLFNAPAYGNTSVELKITLGSATLWDSTSTSAVFAQSANRTLWTMHFTVNNQTNNSFQFMHGRVSFSNRTVPTTGFGSMATSTPILDCVMGGYSAINTASTQSLTVTATLGTNSASSFLLERDSAETVSY